MAGGIVKLAGAWLTIVGRALTTTHLEDMTDVQHHRKGLDLRQR
jgi:hypothetical protein